MVISLGLFDRPALAGYGCSRLSTSASHLITLGSEIAAGRIALFSRFALPRPDWCMSPPPRRSGTRTWPVARLVTRLPGFHQAPLRGAARTFLEQWRTITRDHPFARVIRLSTCGRLRGAANSRCRRGDLNSHG